jgi:hypothetical protein
MDYSLIGNEFCKKFYQWRLLDAEREVLHDFPFLRMMKNPCTERDLASIMLFSSQDRLRLLKALIKITVHPELRIALGDKLDESEKALLKQFHLLQLKVSRSDPHVVRLFDENYEKVNFREFNRRFLKKVILEELASIIDIPPKSYGADCVQYVQKIGEFDLITTIEIEKISYYYNQQIWTLDNGKRSVLGGVYCICLSYWLGLQNGKTWCFTAEEDPSIAARNISRLCLHFTSALPQLLGEHNLLPSG